MIEGLVLAIGFVIAALAIRPPDNAVVLLPDEDGSVGRVVVMQDGRAVELSSANAGLSLDGNIDPGRVRTFSEQQIQTLFGDALRVQPAPARSYLLYYDTGSSGLGAEERAVLMQVLSEVERRPEPRVAIIGHTDRVGPAAVNAALGLQRAQTVRDALVAGGIAPPLITLRSHGEGDALVPTADEVSESRNRRVEVMVR